MRSPLLWIVVPMAVIIVVALVRSHIHRNDWEAEWRKTLEDAGHLPLPKVEGDNQ